MGVDFSASITVGIEVDWSTFWEEGERMGCPVHGPKKGKCCSECGKPLELESTPTDALARAAKLAKKSPGDLWDHLKWGESEWGLSLSRMDYDEDDEGNFILGGVVAGTESHRSNYPIGETSVREIQETLDDVRAALKRIFDMEAEPQVFVVGHVSY